ncbi:MAG: hypothetical protein A2033_09090 [Bacteroidetes bacterium GWA2_31_9]|nr:MAG: hypothetical protein A2033_09090 [Bacteroidetes bacterium GWA2_31_9]
MKKIILLSIITILFSVRAFSGTIELEGVFQGKNLYVMNPFSSSGVGFCVYEVTVNGQVTTDEINSSAFEIDLSIFQLSLGEKINVAIKHKENCKPKILNPEVLKPKSTYSATNLVIDKEGNLSWTTTGEAGKLPFIVEQYRWNKWIKVAEIEGKGISGTNSYSAKVSPHSGSNKFRIKQIDYSKTPRYSSEVPFRSMQPPVTVTSTRVTNEVVFSSETMYEIYDYYGNIVLKGVNSKVDISGLEKGKYFLNYDNQMEEITKK